MEFKNVKLEECIASGPYADIYRVDNWAIKVFKEKRPKTDILYEALVNAFIEDTGLNVPRVRDVSRLDNGQWVIASQIIEGETLLEKMQQDKKNLDSYVEQMVNLQLEIHKQRVPRLVKLKDKLMTRIHESEEIDKTAKYDMMTRLEGLPKHVKLCHGNFSPSNIILSKDKLYIVDWIEASQGNASADAAKSYLLLKLECPEAADKYMELFCKKSETDKKYVQKWLPIVAASHLQYVTDSKDKELLKQWANVVEYQ